MLGLSIAREFQRLVMLIFPNYLYKLRLQVRYPGQLDTRIIGARSSFTDNCGHPSDVSILFVFVISSFLVAKNGTHHLKVSPVSDWKCPLGAVG